MIKFQVKLVEHENNNYVAIGKIHRLVNVCAWGLGLGLHST